MKGNCEKKNHFCNEVCFSHSSFCPLTNTSLHCGMKIYWQSTYIWASNLLATFPMILQLTKRDCSVWESCALETSGFRIYVEKERRNMSRKIVSIK